MQPIEEPEDILSKYKTIAVVGCSRDPSKDANKVPTYMQAHGYTVVPVNPNTGSLLGVKCYPSLKAIPDEIAETIDVVEVFRPRAEAGSVVRQAVEFKRTKAPNLKVVWLQYDIYLTDREKDVSEEAQRAGLEIIQNRCMMVDHKELLG